MTPILPPDYVAIFHQRMCIVTGVGRSGTTILGKLIGSMSPSVYLFEPLFVRLMPLLIERTDPGMRPAMSQFMLSVLFEDYIANVVNGRSLNFNQTDDSFYGNYIEHADLERRWDTLTRRDDLLRLLESRPTSFVVKIPEFQPLFDLAEGLFPEPKYIQITRNGFDVIASASKRGWYSDDFLNRNFLDWMEKGSGSNLMPWYVDDVSREHFPRWTQTTRAASVWRRLTEIGLDYVASHPDRSRNLSYEMLATDPEETTADLGSWLGLTSTEITKRHLRAVEQHSFHENNILISDIEEPEQAPFANLMKRLEYM